MLGTNATKARPRYSQFEMQQVIISLDICIQINHRIVIRHRSVTLKQIQLMELFNNFLGFLTKYYNNYKYL